MTERLFELILDESKWLFFAMLLSLVATVATCRLRRSDRSVAARALNLFYGWMLGVMAAGHLLAVTVMVVQGSPTRLSLWLLYPLGVALAVPAWWLVARETRPESPSGKTVLALNAWLGVALLAFGLHNWPLALPAALNIAHARVGRTLARVIVAVTVTGYLALFAGATTFYLSGQSFEEFSADD